MDDRLRVEVREILPRVAGSREERRVAMQQLRRLGRPAVAALLSILDTGWRRKETDAAAAALPWLGDEAILELATRLAATRPHEESLVETALCQAVPAWRGSPSGPEICRALVRRGHPGRRDSRTLPAARPAVEAVVPDIIRVWDEGSERERAAAEDLLARLGAAAAPSYDAAVRRLGDESDGSAKYALVILASAPELPDATIRALSALLSAGSAHTRRRAAAVLGTVGDRASVAVPALLDVVRDDEEHARMAAVRALLWMPGSADQWAGPVAEAMANASIDDWEVAASRAIEASVRAPEFPRLLSERVRQPGRTVRTSGVRTSRVRALLVRGIATEYLRDLASRDEDPRVRAVALVGSTRSAVDGSRSDPTGGGREADPSRARVAVRFLDDPDPDLRVDAARILCDDPQTDADARLRAESVISAARRAATDIARSRLEGLLPLLSHDPPNLFAALPLLIDDENVPAFLDACRRAIEHLRTRPQTSPRATSELTVALGRLGPRATPLLPAIRAWWDESRSYEARAALAALTGDPREIALLGEVSSATADRLAGMGPAGVHALPLLAARAALVGAGPPAISPGLVRSPWEDDRRDGSPSVVVAIAEALGVAAVRDIAFGAGPHPLPAEPEARLGVLALGAVLSPADGVALSAAYLDDPSGPVRHTAWDLLVCAETREPGTVRPDVLPAGLRAADRRVQASALYLARAMGPAAAPALGEIERIAGDTQFPGPRSAAAVTLWRVTGDPSACCEVLREECAAPDDAPEDFDWRGIADFLGRADVPEDVAVAVLRAISRTERSEVIAALAPCAERLGPRAAEAVPILRSVLAREFDGDAHWTGGDPSIPRYLASSYSTRSRNGTGGDVDHRTAVLRALRAIGPAAVTARPEILVWMRRSEDRDGEGRRALDAISAGR